jgi:hypothetical protein
VAAGADVADGAGAVTKPPRSSRMARRAPLPVRPRMRRVEKLHGMKRRRKPGRLHGRIIGRNGGANGRGGKILLRSRSPASRSSTKCVSPWRPRPRKRTAMPKQVATRRVGGGADVGGHEAAARADQKRRPRRRTRSLPRPKPLIDKLTPHATRRPSGPNGSRANPGPSGPGRRAEPRWPRGTPTSSRSPSRSGWNGGKRSRQSP